MTPPSAKVYPENQEKVCTLCFASLRLNNFGKSANGRFGRHSQCRECRKIRKGEPRKSYYIIPIEERFWKYVQKTDTCWIWIGARLSKNGYGVLGKTEQGEDQSIYRNVTTHRFSWELHFGMIPEGLLVCHHCDNPPCVNPSHLFLGTDQDNVDDMFRKGREPHRNTKLRPADIPPIRQMLARGDRPVDIAILFGVNRTTICDVRSGRRWAKIV